MIANVTLAAFLWAILPLLLGLTLAITRAGSDLVEVYLDFNPFVHAFAIAQATARTGGLDNYDFVRQSLNHAAIATAWMVLNFILYVGVAMLFLARAWSRMRRNPI